MDDHKVSEFYKATKIIRNLCRHDEKLFLKLSGKPFSAADWYLSVKDGLQMNHFETRKCGGKGLKMKGANGKKVTTHDLPHNPG